MNHESIARRDYRDLVIEDQAYELAMQDERINSLEESLGDAQHTIAELTDVLADVTLQNIKLKWIADYRLRHNPDLLDTLTRAAKAGAGRASFSDEGEAPAQIHSRMNLTRRAQVISHDNLRSNPNIIGGTEGSPCH